MQAEHLQKSSCGLPWLTSAAFPRSPVFRQVPWVTSSEAPDFPGILLPLLIVARHAPATTSESAEQFHRLDTRLNYQFSNSTVSSVYTYKHGEA